MKQVFRGELNPSATPRRCSKCASRAVYFVYLPDRNGQPNKSAKRFACAEHGKAAA